MDFRIPIPQQHLIHLLNGSKWAVSQADDPGMTEVQIGSKKDQFSHLAFYHSLAVSPVELSVLAVSMSKSSYMICSRSIFFVVW